MFKTSKLYFTYHSSLYVCVIMNNTVELCICVYMYVLNCIAQHSIDYTLGDFIIELY